MTSNEALGNYQKFANNRTGAGNYYDQALQQSGANASLQNANDMRGVLRNTEQALKGVGASVQGRTQGSLVTDAQRQRLQNIETQPLADQLNQQQTGYNDEMQNYRDLLGQAQTKAGMQYQGDSDTAGALMNSYNSIFGQEKEGAAEHQASLQLQQNQRQFDAQQALEERKLQASIAAANKQAAAMGSLSFSNPSSGGGSSDQNSVDYNKILNALNKSQPKQSAPTQGKGNSALSSIFGWPSSMVKGLSNLSLFRGF